MNVSPFHRLAPLAIIAAITAVAALPASAQESPSAAANKDLSVVQLIATGGTIAMKIDPVKKAPVPAISGEDLIATVPDIAKVAKIEVVNQSNVPSDYMDQKRWIELHKAVTAALARKEVAGVIVSHGTDTLEETAWFLDLTVKSDKPVVCIGAQRNASEPDFDGPRNLLNAAKICVAPEAKGKGTLLVLNNQINAAREVTKTHTSDVETFKSGDWGFLGTVDADRIVFARAPLRRQAVELKSDATTETLPRVEIVYFYGGADAKPIQAAVKDGAKGIVIAAAGWGNVNEAFHAAIKEAAGQGVKVVISTRVPNGRALPVYGFVGGGKTLKEAGAIFADNLNPQKARILLMLAMQHTQKTEELQKVFDR